MRTLFIVGIDFNFQIYMPFHFMVFLFQLRDVSNVAVI